MIEFIFSQISLSNILALPPIIKYPGFLILALLTVRGIRAILTLKPFRALSNLILFVVVSFILSRFGQGIAKLLETQNIQGS